MNNFNWRSSHGHHGSKSRELEQHIHSHTYIFLPENLGRHCQEWPAGKVDSKIRQLIQKNSKPQDLIVYTDGSVTQDQSGWGFTVKQGATTIHKNSAAYEVSTSSLTMETEAVIHALHWIA